MKRQKIVDAFDSIELEIKKATTADELDDIAELVSDRKAALVWTIRTSKISFEMREGKEETTEQMLVRIRDPSQWVPDITHSECEFGVYCVAKRKGACPLAFYRPRAVFGTDDCVLCDMCVRDKTTVEKQVTFWSRTLYRDLLDDQLQRVHDRTQWTVSRDASKSCSHCDEYKMATRLLKKEISGFEHPTYDNWELCDQCFECRLEDHILLVNEANQWDREEEEGES